MEAHSSAMKILSNEVIRNHFTLSRRLSQGRDLGEPKNVGDVTKCVPQCGQGWRHSVSSSMPNFFKCQRDIERVFDTLMRKVNNGTL